MGNCRRVPGTCDRGFSLYLLHSARRFRPCATSHETRPASGAARHHLRQFARPEIRIPGGKIFRGRLRDDESDSGERSRAGAGGNRAGYRIADSPPASLRSPGWSGPCLRNRSCYDRRAERSMKAFWPRLLTTALTALVAASLSLAGTVHGSVINRTTGKPIPNTDVDLLSPT